MKILFLAPQPFYQERGTPIAVRLAVEILCAAGHTVDLLTYRGGQDVHIPGLTITRVGPRFMRHVPIGFSWRKVVFDMYMLAHLLRRVVREHYDVIHAVEESVFLGALVKRLARAQLVYDMDSSLAEQLMDKYPSLRHLRAFFDSAKRWAIRRSDLILPVCEGLAERARMLGAEGPVVVLHDIAEEAEPAAAGEDLRAALRLEGLLILYVGNLERYQGIDLLLEAIARVRSAVPYRLVVIGGSPREIAQYEALAQRLEVGDRVRFIGPRPFKHLQHYLSQADILVSPRLMGINTPLKFYAYMLSGKAILATGIRSHRQVVDETSAVLTEATADAFADGLEKLLADPDLRARLGARAREIAKTRYNRENYREKLLAAYTVLAGSKTP